MGRPKRAADGGVVYHLLNRANARMTIFESDADYAALVLAGDSPEAFNDIENPNRVTPQKTTLTFIQGAVNLPPHSLTIIKVPLK